MQKAFFSNIILLILINILIKPIYLFGIDAQVQNAVGPESYGIYFALINFVFLFQVLLDPGLQNYNTKTLSENNDQAVAIFRKSFTLKLILAFDFSMLVLLIAYFVFPQLYLTHIFYIIGIQILLSFYLFFRSHFSALGDYRKDVFFSGLDKLLMICLIGYFIYYESIDIEKFLLLQLIAYALANVIIILFLRRKIMMGFNFNIEELMELLQKAFPFALVFLLMTLYTRMDGVMLERLVADEGLQAGIYAAAYRLLDAANMIAFLFATLLLPMFAKILKDQAKIEELSLLALKMMLVIICAVVVSSIIYGEEILALLYKDYTVDYYQTFLYLIGSFMAIGISYIYGTLITASGNLTKFNMVFIVGIVINWSFNLYAIPRYGAQGAAVATFVTQFIVMIAQTVLAYRQFKLRIHWDFILKFAVLLGVSLYFNHALQIYTGLYWWINMLLGLILMGILSILAGFLRLKWIFGMAFE